MTYSPEAQMLSALCPVFLKVVETLDVVVLSRERRSYGPDWGLDFTQGSFLEPFLLPVSYEVNSSLPHLFILPPLCTDEVQSWMSYSKTEI